MNSTKNYYDVKVETMVPATLVFRVYADSPEKAVDEIKGKTPIVFDPNLAKRKDKKIIVYEAYQCIIKFIKNL